MQRPSYWLLSDPAMNRQFRRGWEHPPPKPKRRSPAPLAGGNRAMSSASTGGLLFNPPLNRTQARAVAEALFRMPA